MSPEDLYLQNLGLIKRIAASVGRRYHLNPDEIDEFTQDVAVRLLDDNYGVIRKFENRSSFSTYLTTVIGRLFHQHRVEMWGKWRPSAEAKRLGDKAITLERLLTRDGYSFDEAVKILTTPAGTQYTETELEAIYAHLPHRNPRPMIISTDTAPDVVAIESNAYDNAARSERRRLACELANAVNSEMHSMDPLDQLLLRERFTQARKVPDIARRLNMDQKKAYKRIEALCGRMRKSLEKAGLNGVEIGGLLNTDTDLQFDVLRGESEINGPGPSNRSGGGGPV